MLAEELMIVVLLKDIRFENNSACGRFTLASPHLVGSFLRDLTRLFFFLVGSRNCGFLRCAFPIDIFTRAGVDGGCEDAALWHRSETDSDPGGSTVEETYQDRGKLNDLPI